MQIQNVCFLTMSDSIVFNTVISILPKNDMKIILVDVELYTQDHYWVITVPE